MIKYSIRKRRTVISLLTWMIYGTLMCQTSSELRKVLQLARTNNPELKSQMYAVSIAETDIITAGLRPNPVLNNQSLQLAKPLYFAPGTTWDNGRNRQVWWQLTKQFPLPQVRNHKIEFAKRTADQYGYTYKEEERQLLYKVAAYWIEVVALSKELLALQNVKENTDTLMARNKLQKNPVVNSGEQVKDELMLHRYALNIRSLEQNYKSELANLQLVTGVTGSFETGTGSDVEFEMPESLEQLTQKAIEQRPDVLSYRSFSEAASSNIKLQKSLALPTPELGAIYNPQNTIPYVGFFGTLQIPIFSRNQGEIKKSYLLKQQSDQNVGFAQARVRIEVSSAYATYQSDKLNYRDVKQMMIQSDLFFKEVEKTFRAGAISLHVYLEEQNNRLDIQKLYYDTLKMYGRSYIQLLYVTGLINSMVE